MNILDMEVVREIISEINSYENIERKRKEFISHEMGGSKTGKYVTERLKQMFPKTYDQFITSEYSLVKKIRNKKAKAYKEPPMRILGNTNENDLYNSILSDGRYNSAMKEIDKIFNQHKYAGLYFEYDSIQDRVKFYPLKPFEFDIIKDDDGRVSCLILSYPGKSVTGGNDEKLIAGDRANSRTEVIKYVMWTKENHVVVELRRNSKMENVQLDFIEIDNNPDGINPYGLIPFTYIPLDFSEDYPDPSNLPNQTRELNVLISTYLSSANIQVGQLVVKFPNDQAVETISLGMMTALKLPQSKEPEDKPTEAEYISPTPNLSGHREAILTNLSLILDENDINVPAGVITDTQQFASALDRLLSQADVQSVIEDNQELYTRLEQENFEVINAMTFGFFKSTKITTVFKKPRLITSDKDRLDTIKQKEEMGLLLPWEKFMEYDPNLTEEEAKLKWQRINEYKKESQQPNDNMNTNNPNNVDLNNEVA